VGDGRDTDLGEKLAEVGRKVGQAVDAGLKRLQPGFDALAAAVNRPEVRAVIDGAERALRRRPCLCFCMRAHPDDHSICETFDAVVTGTHSSALLGDIEVPLCAPCAAARAARKFTG
jgi:hypothetical protein